MTRRGQFLNTFLCPIWLMPNWAYAELGPRAKDGPVFVAELRRARRLFYEPGDPTYLADIFYGDVNLRFVRG